MMGAQDYSHEDQASKAQALKAACAELKSAGISTAALDARLLLACALQVSAEDLAMLGAELIAPQTLALFFTLVKRRVLGEPVSKIIGRRDFWHASFLVNQDVLDPRPETELLIEASLEFVRSKHLETASLRVLDLGTGSGCLLCALLSELPNARGIGVDVSMPALAVAKKNLHALGLQDRAQLLCANWADALRGSCFDIVVCNPPYIRSDDIEKLEKPVREFDPLLALDGGKDGLDAYKATIPQAFRVINVPGLMVFEAGAGQAPAIEKLMEKQSFSSGDGEIRVWRDLNGIARAVARVRQ